MDTYEEVIEKIQNARRFGNLPGIEVTKILLEEFGHPEEGIPFIHVAGTNGKGSTCAFLGSILRAAGYKVGIFTSPHLIHFEERITINGQMIPKEAVVRLGNQILQQNLKASPTMFDYCLLMALMYFKQEQCDLMILETGLGGSKDSTTAVGIPLVSVITKIGFDHTEILGDTLSKIAGEKAGILKKGTKLVMEQQEEEAKTVICERAKQVGVDTIQIVTEEEIERISKLQLRLKGCHQWENAAAAVETIKLLCDKFPVTKEQMTDGLQSATWSGRMQVISEEPFLMVDGAHNGHGVCALKQSLERFYPNQKFHFIMGVMADKDYLTMIEQLLPLAIDFITVTPESNRALQAKELADMIEQRGVPARSIGKLQEALDQLPKGERTIAFGSLYFIGELLELWSV